MTWRERIQAARAAGRFTAKDYRLWGEIDSCPAGIESKAHGLWATTSTYIPMPLFDLGTEFGDAMRRNAFDECERLLDAIEDRALQLKREASAPAAYREGTR